MRRADVSAASPADPPARRCDVEETELLKCMRREYLTRKRESRGKALERQERLDAIIAETGVDPIKGHSVKPKPKKEDSQQNAGATGAAPAPASA